MDYKARQSLKIIKKWWAYNIAAWGRSDKIYELDRYFKLENKVPHNI